MTSIDRAAPVVGRALRDLFALLDNRFRNCLAALRRLADNRTLTTRAYSAGMSKLKPGKKSVDLQPEARPSRIRREPVRSGKAERLSQNAWWESREWEIRLAIIGIIFFALAINAVVFDLGEVFSR